MPKPEDTNIEKMVHIRGIVPNQAKHFPGYPVIHVKEPYHEL